MKLDKLKGKFSVAFASLPARGAWVETTRRRAR